MRRTTALLAALVLAASAGADTSGSFKLAYRPTPAPVLYDLQRMVMSTDQSGSTKEPPVLFDLKQVISREVTATPEGTLSVMDTVVGEDRFHSAHREQVSSTMAPAVLPRSGTGITPRGEHLIAADVSNIEAILEPAFPADAIKPGHKWETTEELPVSKAKVQVKHEFLAVEVVNGMPCAYVVSEFEVKEGVLEGVKYACRGSGRVGLSLTDGTLISRYAFVTYMDKAPAKGGEPARVSRGEVLHTLTRRPADAAGAAPPTPGK